MIEVSTTDLACNQLGEHLFCFIGKQESPMCFVIDIICALVLALAPDEEERGEPKPCNDSTRKDGSRELSRIPGVPVREESKKREPRMLSRGSFSINLAFETAFVCLPFFFQERASE